MNASCYSRSKRTLWILFWPLPLLFLSFSCSVVEESASPLRTGYGIHVAPGLQLGESKNSVHALVGYERIGFKGGGGHNNFWQAGGQVRHLFGDKPGNEGLWAGGEITFLAVRNKYDNSSLKQTTSGFIVGGLAGYRFTIAKVPLSFYIAPAYQRLGKFKTNGVAFGTGSNGFLGRAGIDVHFASLLSRKGR